jgi:hypothetical protein
MSGHKLLSISEAAELGGCTVENVRRRVMEDRTLKALHVSQSGYIEEFKFQGLQVYAVSDTGAVVDRRSGKAAGNLRFEKAEVIRHLTEWPHAEATCTKETVEQRRARYLAWLTEEQRISPRGALQRVYEREAKQNPKADRANIGKDIRQARGSAKTQKQAGAMYGQLVKDGKRQN